MTEISTKERDPLLQAKPMSSQLNATLLVKKYVKPEPDLIHSLFEQIKTLLDHVRNVRESIEYFNKVETGGTNSNDKNHLQSTLSNQEKIKKI